MPQNILDKPIPEGEYRKVRYFFSTPLEYLFLTVDLLFVLVGIGICWYMAYQDIGNNWLLIINPTIFILIFGLAPFSIVSDWREKSLLYEQEQDLAVFGRAAGCGVGMTNPVATFIFNASFIVCLIAPEELLGDYYPLVWIFFLGIAGPLQSIYIFFIKRRMKKLKKELWD